MNVLSEVESSLSVLFVLLAVIFKADIARVTSENTVFATGTILWTCNAGSARSVR